MRQTLQARVALLQRGETINSWARRYGYDPDTARRVIYRWSNRPGTPRGNLTQRILRDLSLDLGMQIPPEQNGKKQGGN